MMSKVAVIGAGSWGTALAILLARKQQQVVLWGRDSARMAEMQESRKNRKYLPGHSFPDSLIATSELKYALNQADCVLMVVPSMVCARSTVSSSPILRKVSRWCLRSRA